MKRPKRKIHPCSCLKTLSFFPHLLSNVKQTSLSGSLSFLLLFSTWHECLHATSYTVTSNADTDAGFGTSGTLRFCMNAATSAGDTIDCTMITGETISLTADLPAIGNTLTITGAGVTINENNMWTAFQTNTSGTTATVGDMLITNPVAADSNIDGATSFIVSNSSKLANLITDGATTVNASSFNGSVSIGPTGSLTLNSTSSVTAVTPMNVSGTLTATSASITGSVIDNGTATLTNTPVSGMLTVGLSGKLTGTGGSTVIGSLTSSGTTQLNTGASVTGALAVPGGTTSLQTSADIFGSSTVSIGANLFVDGAGTMLNSLDTSGNTTLTNSASITGPANVGITGKLTATNAFLTNALSDNGTALLTNTSVTGPVTVGTTGIFTGSGSKTILNSLTSSGLTTLSNNASIPGSLTVLSGTTSLLSGVKVAGATTVGGGALLDVEGFSTSLNTLDTFGTTMITDSTITGTTIVEPGGTLNANDVFLAGPLMDNGTATLIDTIAAGATLVGSSGTLTASGSGTVLASLTSSGTSTLNMNAMVVGTLSVLAGTTNVQSGAEVLGASTVSPGAFLNVSGPTTSLNTLTTTGTTTLSNNATIASVIIQPSGRLTGVGTVLGNISNQGTFSPGTLGFGTLTSGSYTQANNGTFESVVNGASAGLSNSLGAAMLNGSLFVNVLPNGTFVTPHTYTIITANNVNGSFSSVTLSTPSLFQILYFPTHVDIKVFPLSAMNLSGNALEASDCFLSIPPKPNTDQSIVYNALFQLPANGFQHAFNQMQPSQYSALTWVQMTNALNVQRSLFRHGSLWKSPQSFGGHPPFLPAMPKTQDCHDCGEACYTLDSCPCGLAPGYWRAWADVTGTWQQQSNSKKQYSFHDSSGLFSCGIDGNYAHASLGLLAAYQLDQLTWGQHAGDATMRTAYAGGYAMYTTNYFLIDLSALIGYTTYHANRRIQFSSISRKASGTFNSYEGVAGIGVGSYNTLCGIEWVPFGRVDYVYLSQKAFKERNADSLNLRIGHLNSSMVQAEVGVFFERTCTFTYGLFTPKLSLSYLGQFAVSHKHLNAQFINQSSCTFHARGWGFGRNMFAPTIACTFFPVCTSLAFEMGYTAQYGRRYWNQQGYVGVDWKF